VQFRVLGPIGARSDGRELPLGGPKQRVLAILLLHANDVVSRDRLIDGLWAGSPPPSAAHTLDDYISRLRKALGEARVSRRSPGYTLRVEPDELDLGRFERLVEQGRQELARGDAAGAASRLRDALGLWNGQALADVLYEPFAEAEATQLEERRLAALEDRIGADAALGQSYELVPELQALVRDHPLRERLLGELMVALYRSGRQAEALAAFQTARRRLADELGLEPAPALQRLERAILEQDASLEPALGAARSPAPRTTRAARRARASLNAVRRRRLPLLAAAGLALAVIVTLALASPPSVRRTISTAPADSVGVIGGDGHALRGLVTDVGAPGGIAYGAGAVWVTDTAHDLVVRIDPADHSTGAVPVGDGPAGVAVGGGEVWVVNELGRTVSEVNPGARRQVAAIPVGNGPRAIAFGYRSVWVANATDDTLTRIDPRRGVVLATVALGASPSGLAVGARGVWVTSEESGRLLLVDPSTNRVSQAMLIGDGPRGVAIGAGRVWVANAPDGTVSSFEPGRGRVRKINVGAAPTGVAFAHGAVWVTNGLGGTVSRIDPTTGATRLVRVGNAPTSIAPVRNDIWVTVLPSSASHRGGTMRVVWPRGTHPESVDPAVAYSLRTWQVLSVTNDGLVGYRRVGGLAGDTLVPDLATQLPAPTGGGRTYTFQLRSGIRYSTGALVKPEDIRRAIERTFKLANPAVEGWYAGIVGADACRHRAKGCELRRGIVADDAANTVTFHLNAPDPEFIYKLAFPFADAVPAGTPGRDIGRTPLPATGPYVTRSFSPGHWSLVRNGRFREWSHDAQPDGYPDRIVVGLDTTPRQAAKAIERGTADVLLDPPRSRIHELATRYASQLHTGPMAATISLVLNTRVAPFDRRPARRALDYAIDRGRVVGLAGGPLTAQPTCQILPPTLPGYAPHCPYTSDPNPNGAWSAPDLATAQDLVRTSGTRGAKVTVLTGPLGAPLRAAATARYVVSVLRRLGYAASLEVAPSEAAYWRRLGDSRYRTQIGLFPWYQDYPAASDFLHPLLSCRAFEPGDPSNLNAAEFCNRRIDGQMRRALASQVHDPNTAEGLWGRVDRELVDRAPWVPLYNPRALTALSARVGNYQFHPYWALLLDQLWVR
jgi:ABC-type transport system substrate-binding protein/DNA-binding SARP family transcriptional activator